MKKVSIFLLFITLLKAQDYNLDVGKAVSDGMKQGIQLLGKEMINIATGNKKFNEEKEKENFKEKTNKFDNLKIEGEWTLTMDRVITSFLNYTAQEWKFKFKNDKSFYMFDKKQDYLWKYENDNIQLERINKTKWDKNIEIKFKEYKGDYCYKISYNEAEATMCKTKGERFKDKSKAVKIEMY